MHFTSNKSTAVFVVLPEHLLTTRTGPFSNFGTNTRRAGAHFHVLFMLRGDIAWVDLQIAVLRMNVASFGLTLTIFKMPLVYSWKDTFLSFVPLSNIFMRSCHGTRTCTCIATTTNVVPRAHAFMSALLGWYMFFSNCSTSEKYSSLRKVPCQAVCNFCA